MERWEFKLVIGSCSKHTVQEITSVILWSGLEHWSPNSGVPASSVRLIRVEVTGLQLEFLVDSLSLVKPKNSVLLG